MFCLWFDDDGCPILVPDDRENIHDRVHHSVDGLINRYNQMNDEEKKGILQDLMHIKCGVDELVQKLA